MLSAQFEVPSMTAVQTMAGIVIDITQVTPAALKSPFEWRRLVLLLQPLTACEAPWWPAGWSADTKQKAKVY